MNESAKEIGVTSGPTRMATISNVVDWIEKIVQPVYLRGGHTFEVETGRKYHKIWVYNSGSSGQKTCYGFVDMRGNILKAATYKYPAKHARGSIFSEEYGREALDRNGFIRYLS